jgi:hypothetical protein
MRPRNTSRPWFDRLAQLRNRKFLSLNKVHNIFAAILTFSLVGGASLRGAEEWQEPLSQMPLLTTSKELNRTNCVEVFLSSFQSNGVVKALVFMPGATDEFYLFRRARAVLMSQHPSLLEAVDALTNRTFIRATFRPPYLLLHTQEDSLEPLNTIQDEDTAQRLRQKIRVNQLSCNDRDWDFLQPILKQRLKIALRPWRYSSDSWHFYRHSFIACGINGLQALEIASYAGKSRFNLRHAEARFEVDPRAGTPPKFDAHLR